MCAPSSVVNGTQTYFLSLQTGDMIMAAKKKAKKKAPKRKAKKKAAKKAPKRKAKAKAKRKKK